MKKILILGGTQFIGRNLVNTLQNHSEFEFTLFNRQETNASLFPNAQTIKGDRETNEIQQIEKKKWDFVIDLSCYYPAALQKTLSSLKMHPKKYILISTCSVYNNENNKNELRNETAEILQCTKEQAIGREPDTYGNRKAECERILIQSGINYAILRPALVYGPFDHTDRFYYWLHQVKTRTILLLPDHGERKFSITFVQDLVNCILIHLKKDTTNSIYNVCSTPKASIKEIVNTTIKILQTKNKIINTKPQFLHEQNVKQWVDMPLWLDCDYYSYSNKKIKENLNFTFTDFYKSLQQTINHYAKMDWPLPAFGITEQKKKDLIDRIQQAQTP